MYYRKEKSSKSSIVTTVVVLLVCLVLVTGSTFSLFTSKTGTNIAVTSGNVEMVATIDADSLALYSKGEEQTGKFQNGGTASFNEANTELTLTKITPGDSVSFDIVIENKSTVDLQYRVNWIVEGELADALTATVDGDDITSGTSEWKLWKADATEKSQTLKIAIELPLEADDNWESLEANVAFNVEAVQANATGEYSPVAYVSSAAGLQAALDAGCTEIIFNNDIALKESLVISEDKTVTFNLNGKTITGSMHKNNGAVIKNNGVLTLKNGTVSSLGENGGSALANNGVATLENVTLNGAPNADDSWPSYTVNNAGSLTISDSYITSVHGAVASYGEGALVTLNDCEIDMAGIPGFTSHGIYTYNNGAAVVNGGVYANKAADQASTGGSVINGNVTVNGGTFTGRIENYYGNPVLSGGTYNFDPAKWISDDDVIVFKNSDTSYEVVKGVAYDEENKEYSISTAAGLVWLAKSVNQYSNYEHPFEGVTVKLTCDIDLGGMEWTPIGDYRFSANRFCGTFDGQRHTISNFQITKKTDKNDSNKSSYGFFGNVEGTIKGLTIDNATVSSYAYVGALVGRLNGGVVENCHVTNSTVACSYWQAGGMIGQLNDGCKVVNCTITNSTVTGASAIGGLVGPITATNASDGTVKELTFENCLVKDCAVVQKGSFGVSYDSLFGAMFADIEVYDNATVIKDCVVENTTVKGELSTALYNTISGSNITINGATLTNDVADLDEVLTDGGDIVLSDNLTFDASETNANSGYGATGVSVEGGVLDGNGHSIGITNWGTWDAAVHTTGGTIKNLTINSGMRGIFMGSASGNVYIDNVVIDGTVYTFNSDGGSKEYGVYISNSTLNGWTSYSDVHKEVVFTNCTFGEGNGYAFCRPYNASVFENCVFEEGFEFDTSKTSDITFIDCYYGDTMITAENAANLGNGTFFYNSLNGVTIE